jgi:membrane dipeptidase
MIAHFLNSDEPEKTAPGASGVVEIITGDKDLRERAALILRSHLVWDNHACMPLRPDDTSFLHQIARFQNVTADVVSLNVGFGPQSLDAHMEMIQSFRKWFEARPHLYSLPTSIVEIDKARAEGRLSIVFDVEGMAILDDGGIEAVCSLAKLGVRWMLVAYNRQNAAGGGCYDETDGGLSKHGREILPAMKAAGIVVCCSHTGHRTAYEVMELADNPVIFSHSNADSVFKHSRNIPDALIRACAAGGGVVGINGIGSFLGPNDDDRPETIVRHIDHVAQLVGADHVGVALDYVFDQKELVDYLATFPETFPGGASLSSPLPLAPPEVWPEIVEGLLRLGYAEAEIAKIIGGNWRRVAQQVWI